MSIKSLFNLPKTRLRLSLEDRSRWILKNWQIKKIIQNFFLFLRINFNVTCFLLTLLIVFCDATTNEVSCEKVKQRHWGWVISDQILTCFMDDETRIISDDFTIDLAHTDIVGLLLEHNQNILYLPINIHEAFPNLIGLTAYDCHVNAISNKNFKNLGSLKELHLSNNYIEKIFSNTFEDLYSLEVVFLGKTFIFAGCKWSIIFF